MQSCEQTQNLSVLEHGQQVHAYYRDLVSHMQFKTPLNYEWRLPEWLAPGLLERTHDPESVRQYQIYHDCGKPYCLEVDDQGRRHFPDHQKVSELTARKVGFSDTVCRLIGRDMEIHLLKDVGIADFMAAGDSKDAVTLLLTGLCEIHANAAMFGGVESVSFKQKWKQINKRGKKIILQKP